jgi:hypothetical protein
MTCLRIPAAIARTIRIDRWALDGATGSTRQIDTAGVSHAVHECDDRHQESEKPDDAESA